MTQPRADELPDEIDPTSELGAVMFGDTPEAIQEWIEMFLTVPNERGQIVPMKLYPQQTSMLVDETGRDIIVKGRQTRATSLKLARNLRSLVNGELWGATMVCGAQDDATTESAMRARIRHHILNDLKPKFGLEITLDNRDELRIAGFENRIIFISGEMKTMSRGYAVQRAHLSELAHWKDTALDLIGGMMPAIPPPPYGRATFESTPRGEQGAFYEYAMNAKPLNSDPQAQWTVHLYPWWMEPRYTVSDDQFSGCDIVLPRAVLAQMEAEYHPTDHEGRLIAEHSLDVRRMLWRRIKKLEQDRTQAPFLQEYPEDLDTCWLGLEGKFFDTPDGVDHLEYYRDSRRPPIKMHEKLTYKGAEISFYGPNLCIWEYPDAQDTYVMGFDTAGGGIGKDSDYSVLYVLSVRKEKVVARLRVQCSPKVFAAMICAVGNFYQTAWVSGERSHQGADVFEEIRDLQYPNVYYHVDPFKHMSKNDRPLPGLYPSESNRRAILEKLKTAVTSGALESFDAELVREMNVFTWQKFAGRMKAQAIDLVGQHDDCIFAIAHAWYIIDKARTRLRSRNQPQEEEIIVAGPNNVVVRRGLDQPFPRAQQVWFT